MNENNVIEASAATVEEAVEKGLAEIGAAREDVNIEVLDEGKRNLFRFASRQARVRLTLREPGSAPARPVKPAQERPITVVKPEIEQSTIPTSEMVSGYEEQQAIVAETTLEILKNMGISAVVNTRLQMVEESETPVVYVNIEGADLSFLIGRKSETLNALQHITGLIASRRFGDWIPIQLDVQNYRARRVVELQKLARRIADQVASTDRKQCLEPMPANERRIIHMELRDNPRVYSESTGEEPNRKVCVHPRK